MRARASRKTNPDKINYIRVATTDDIQGPADRAVRLQHARPQEPRDHRRHQTFGKGIADAFQAELESSVAPSSVAMAPRTTDFTAILTKFKDAKPDAVFYGGVTTTGGGLLLQADAASSASTTSRSSARRHPDGTGDTDGSFINIAGEAAANTLQLRRRDRRLPGQGRLRQKYKAEYNEEAGAYSASAYACAQIVLKATRRPPACQGRRDLARPSAPAASDPATTFETVLGPRQVRRGRRHQPEVHLPLQGRSHGRRQGRLGLRLTGDYAE